MSDTVDVNSDEGMLREAHDLLRFASFAHSPMRWVAADLVERIATRYPDSADVIEHNHAPWDAEDMADRLRSIANIVDRHGAYEALHDIADELDGRSDR